MGFEAVWQLIGWFTFVFGVPVLLTALMPEKWFTDMTTPGKRKWFVIILWMMVLIASSIAGWMVHENGTWIEHGIALALFVVVNILGAVWAMVYHWPNQNLTELMPGIHTMAAVLAAASIWVFILFIARDVVGGILILPLIGLWFYYWTSLFSSRYILDWTESITNN